MDKNILNFDDMDLDTDNEYVIKSQKIGEKLKEKGYKIKELNWKNYKAS